LSAFQFGATSLLALGAMCGTMAVAWLVQGRTGKSGWADAFWAFGVGATAIIISVAPASANWRQWVACFAGGSWSLRLGSHIAARTHAGSDDPRYAELNRQWGAAARRRMFYFLQSQALVGAALAIAVAVAAHNPTPFPSVLDVVAICLLALSVAGEALADAQLKQFKSRNREQASVCDAGLWRWSRHPNYFFEWLFWVAIAFIAADPSGTYAVGYLGIAAPLLMYYVLVHVSGIPPLEAHMSRSRGAAFRLYQRRTSPFFPLPPKRRE
jgi:steroid 5-alpha reductase family enzyme